MDTTKLSAKGQVVLPKRVRDELGWEIGTEFIVERSGTGVTLRPKSRARKGSIRELSGALQHKGRPVSLGDMEQSIVREAKRRRESGRY